MRLRTQILLVPLLLAAALAPAQQQPPYFSHVVIIFQENRTPDNIFGSAPAQANCTQEDPFEPGVDIVDGGLNLASKEHMQSYTTCLAPNSGLRTGGGYHGHNGNDTGYKYQGWVPQCDYNSSTGMCQMDGACLGTWPYCNQYQYVDKAAVQPYFDIATSYGFANYMFMTHEGPSFEAHQFIFGGSSAPVFPGDDYYQWFVSELPGNGITNDGCPAYGTSGWPLWVDPDGNEPTGGVPDNTECYDRNTLVTYQDSTGAVHDWTASWGATAQPAWKYYIPIDNSADGNAAIWNGPEADPQTCYLNTAGTGACMDPTNEYKTHISVATTRKRGSAPILTDIANCQLPAISWVIPDERCWSDHPGPFAKGTGPDWVATIVDAIGQSYQNSGGACDYWGYGNNSPNPEPTAILIAWDDWGGFYDHVPPPAVYQGDANDQCTPASGNPNGWGCGYVYGFRVPLMVVSNWTPAGYVSGPISGTPSYPPPAEWTHDFGSILAFIENNFTQQGLNLPYISKPYYADYNALDSLNHTVTPLWDFFQGPQRDFTYINPINSADTASFFMNYYYNNPGESPIGPEAGDPLD